MGFLQNLVGHLELFHWWPNVIKKIKAKGHWKILVKPNNFTEGIPHHPHHAHPNPTADRNYPRVSGTMLGESTGVRWIPEFLCYNEIMKLADINTGGATGTMLCNHDDVIKWKHFLRYWPFVRGIHRSPVNSPHKGQWRGALMFSLICAWITDWVNNREAGDLRR